MKALLAAAVISALSVTSASAVTVANGGFANSALAGSFLTVPAGNDTAVPGWLVTTGDVDAINGYWQSADGDGFSIDLNGNQAGSIAQVIEGLQIGRTYLLKFAMSGNPDGGPSVKTLVAGMFMSGWTTFSYDTAANGTTRGDMKWVQKQFAFTATHETDYIIFESETTAQCCFGPAVDAVSIELAPIPLPAGLPLLAAALGGLTLLRRRRG
jgi:choice-of-anchor C domain-containing protein